jgi:polyferredoxin
MLRSLKVFDAVFLIDGVMMWVVLLEGEDLGELFLTKLGKFWRWASRPSTSLQRLIRLDRVNRRNRRSCMRNLMTEEEAKGVFRVMMSLITYLQNYNNVNHIYIVLEKARSGVPETGERV